MSNWIQVLTWVGNSLWALWSTVVTRQTLRRRLAPAVVYLQNERELIRRRPEQE